LTTLVLVTGGFDPLHSGHIAYFKAAKQLASYGGKLIVGVNSDAWLQRKKGKPFMPYKERSKIVQELSCVDRCISFDDNDDTANGAILNVVTQFNFTKLIFANGGDRTQGNCPEYNAWKTDKRIQFEYGVGGFDKANSSSWILKDWSAPKVNRDWGYYRNLYNGDGFRVKELVINPYSKLSMQIHEHRSETWNLVSGTAKLYLSNRQMPVDPAIHTLQVQNPIDIPSGVWHRGVNDSDNPAHIVEIWKGPSELLSEDDIRRWDPIKQS
jgi:cytidyltransferase-like protein